MGMMIKEIFWVPADFQYGIIMVRFSSLSQSTHSIRTETTFPPALRFLQLGELAHRRRPNHRQGRTV
jgi:hypothetical protein